MSKLARDIWSDIRAGQNIDSYTVILLSIVVAVLSAFSITSGTVSLAVLLAAAALITAQGLRISKAVSFVAKSSSGALLWLADRDYAGSISGARRISMLTIANYRFLGANNDAFYACLTHGGTIRELMLNPESTWGSRVALSRSVGASARPDHLPNHYTLTVNKLAEFAAVNPLAVVDVRRTLYPPAHVITWIEYYNSPAEVYVVPSGFKQRTEGRPSIRVGQYTDPRSYEYFTSYFENLWNWEETHAVTFDA